MLKPSHAQGAVKFVAKIGYANAASRRLFAQLGYTEAERSEVFREVTLQLIVDDAVRADLLEKTGPLWLSKHDAP